MKELKKDLQAVLKSLKRLTRKTEQMAKRLDKLEKTPAAKKPKPKKSVKVKSAKMKVTKKAVKVTAIDAVLSVIGRSKKGVTTAQIKKKTGFEEKKVWNNINFLKRKGKVKSAGRGVYVKVL